MVDARRKLLNIAKEHTWGAVDEITWNNLDNRLKTPAEHCEWVS